MLRFLKGFFDRPKHPDITPAPEPTAPYKIEAPAPEPTAPAPTLAVDGHGDDHEVKPAVKPKKAPAKKKPAVIKAAPKPKTPRKPRATK